MSAAHLGGNTCSIIQFSFDKQRTAMYLREANKKITTQTVYRGCNTCHRGQEAAISPQGIVSQNVLTGLHNRRPSKNMLKTSSQNPQEKTQMGS